MNQTVLLSKQSAGPTVRQFYWSSYFEKFCRDRTLHITATVISIGSNVGSSTSSYFDQMHIQQDNSLVVMKKKYSLIKLTNKRSQAKPV